MNKIIGIGMLLLSCGMIGYKIYGGGDFGPRYNAQMLISGIGGAYLVISEFYQSIIKLFQGVKSFFNKTQTKISVSKEATMETQEIELQKIMTGADKKLCDFVALLYLKNRCIESGLTEVMDHVVAINTLLFSNEAKIASKVGSETTKNP